MGDFNPRSHEGSDSLRMDMRSVLFLFQSTLPRRERREQFHISDRTARISIHAPTKGATKLICSIQNRCKNFNPRSHEGSDKTTANISILVYRFQSTLPRRERRISGCFNPLPGNFNPRSHEGSDSTKICLLIKTQISIHAPTKGATNNNIFQIKEF